MEFPATSALAVATFLLVSAASPGGAEYKKTEYLVRPNSLNRRGIIGPGRICPKNTYAIGFKMKVKERNKARGSCCQVVTPVVSAEAAAVNAVGIATDAGVVTAVFL